jgi:hypothetical protein
LVLVTTVKCRATNHFEQPIFLDFLNDARPDCPIVNPHMRTRLQLRQNLWQRTTHTRRFTGVLAFDLVR